MPDMPAVTITRADAEAFAARYGLARLTPADIDALRAGMERSLAAGLAVTRVASKFDAPAPTFRVADIG